MKTKKGLTLVGSIVAVGILGVSFIAFLQYQSFLVRANIQKKYSAVGTYLAAEGLEIVRGVRDANFKEYRNGNITTAWDTGINAGAYSISYDVVNLGAGISVTLSTTCSAQNLVLTNACRLRETDSGYVVSSGSPTSNGVDIYRVVEIGNKTSNSLDILSTVEIQDRGYRVRYQSATRLYNTDL